MDLEITEAEHPTELQALYELIVEAELLPQAALCATPSTEPAATADSSERGPGEHPERLPMPLPYFNNDNQEDVIAEVLTGEAVDLDAEDAKSSTATDDDDTVEVARVVEHGLPIRIMSNGRREQAVLVTHGERGHSGAFPPG